MLVSRLTGVENSAVVQGSVTLGLSLRACQETLSE